MLTLENTINRVRQLLDDAEGTRFSDELLTAAIRQALERLDETLPRLMSLDFCIVTADREQTIEGLGAATAIVEVRLQSEGKVNSLLIPGEKFSVTLEGDSAVCRFKGRHNPHVGDVLQVAYCARNTLSGLDGAEISSLLDAAGNALEMMCAGQACLLRAAMVAEAYSARPGESMRLTAQSRMWMDLAERLLQQFHPLYGSVYPPGFALDTDDRRGRRA